MAGRKGVFFYFEDSKQFSLLSDEQLGALFRGLLTYAQCEERPEFSDPAVNMAFAFLSARDEREAKKYIEICRKRQEAGSKGGRPQKPIGCSENQLVSDESKKSQLQNQHQNQHQHQPHNQFQENMAGKPPRAARFTPPTVDQVSAFCSARGNVVDPQRFVDFYETRGWKLSSGVPMKSWQAAVRTWEYQNTKKESCFIYDAGSLEGSL